MKSVRLFLIAVLLAAPAAAYAQVYCPDGKCGVAQFGVVVKPAEPVAKPAPEPQAEEVADTSAGFRRSLVKAAREAARAGEISRFDAIKIRVASLSPAFLERAQDLCIVQMAFSGDEAVDDLPRTESGSIDREEVNWASLLAFLQAIMPLILQLINAFGA